MVVFLIERYGRYKLNELLVEAGRGEDFSLAVTRVYGEFMIDYQGLQEQWLMQLTSGEIVK